MLICIGVRINALPVYYATHCCQIMDCRSNEIKSNLAKQIALDVAKGLDIEIERNKVACQRLIFWKNHADHFAFL